MRYFDVERLLELVKKYKKNPRSNNEIRKSFLAMKLIDKDNNLQSPYFESFLK